MPLLLIVLLILAFGFAGGCWGHANYGQNYPYAGPGIGIGTILVIVLILYLLGGLHL